MPRRTRRSTGWQPSGAFGEFGPHRGAAIGELNVSRQPTCRPHDVHLPNICTLGLSKDHADRRAELSSLKAERDGGKKLRIES